jgi:hypothetical protein
MTTVTLGPVPCHRPLTDAERARNLEWLARSADTLALHEVSEHLDRWAHQSLLAHRREVLFARLYDSQLPGASALSAPVRPRRNLPHLPGRRSAARALLAALTYGEK